MYYNHFGLTQPPFRITPNTEFFYSGGNRGPILDALIYAIGQGEGIIKVTGEVGSGKTMLCNMLQARLPAAVETVYLPNPSVSPEEILHAIAFELQLGLPREAGRLETMQAVHDYLLERHAQGKQVVVFLEESQSMPLATLEEIRLLSNLETPDSKLLQIVLFGQPEFEDNLRQPQIRQLRERITHSFRLAPLKLEEIRGYLNFRLRAAGYRGPDLFSASVIKAIARASAGLTRRINLIADKALLAAFAENTHAVKLKHVRAAVRDSEFSNGEPARSRWRLAPGIALFVAGAGIGAAFFALAHIYQSRDTAAVPHATPATPGPSAANNATEPTAAKIDSAATEARSAAVAKTPKAPASIPEASRITSAPATQRQAEPAPVSVTPIKTRASEASAHSQAVAAMADTLKARLVATETWLAQQDKSTYSIQLFGADDAQQLKRYLNIASEFIEINDIFVYRTVAKQKPSLTVLYGSFSERRTALDTLAKLPAQLRTYRPYLRTVQGIRAEIASHRHS